MYFTVFCTLALCVICWRLIHKKTPQFRIRKAKYTLPPQGAERSAIQQRLNELRAGKYSDYLLEVAKSPAHSQYTDRLKTGK